MTTGILQSQAHPTPGRRHRRRRLNPVAAILAVAIATGLALTGCTPQDSPPNAGTSPPTTQATPTPPATAAPTTPPAPVYKPATANGPAVNVPTPVLPAKAKEFSKAGLEEFSRYWYTTLGYVYETGDSKPMMAITDPSCKTCAKTNGPASEWYQSGGWITGGKMKVYSSTSSFQQSPDGSYQAILMIEQSRVSYYKPDGTLDEALDATVARADIIVARYADARWTAQTAEHLTKE